MTELFHELETSGEERSVNRIILPAKPARYAEPEEPLAAEIVERLAGVGIKRLYAHQAQSLDLVRAGRHIIVTTGTASGKSLCFNLPVLEALLADPKARTLYLFPTKALAQDQLRSLSVLGLSQAATFDGDTPVEARSEIRKEGRLVLTNPDMLHRGILPSHKRWATFFMNLRFVVIDEAHALRGAFGSNVANVFRRLRRICAYYGSSPQFILTSATIANPGEHAAALTGLDVAVVSGDGAPRGRKFFLLWNPPLLDQVSGKRRSSSAEASAILASLVRQGLRTICFSKTRKSAELVFKHARDFLSDDADLAAAIAPYRAGYLPEARRQIERALFSGDLVAVSATNALELGIDVGTLDAAVINGFPGTITSAWQQAGRAGRREGDSIAVLIAGEDPLDQYYVRHPEYFFARNVEEAVVDLENAYINREHVACAAYELPLTDSDQAFFDGSLDTTIQALDEAGVIKRSSGKAFYAGRDFPAGNRSIRGSSGSEYRIIDETGRLIGTVDAERALFDVYPGAVYLHQGETYVIGELDLATHVAVASRSSVDYFTQLKVDTNLWIDRGVSKRDISVLEVSFGRVTVESAIIGFQKKLVGSGEALGFEALELPPLRFQTEAFWFTTPPGLDIGLLPKAFAGGLHAVEHTAIALLPLHAMCDRWDVGGISTPLHHELDRPAVFVYDGYAGGVGIALRGFGRADGLLEAVLAHLRACPCDAGCPSCIQSPKCGNLNDPLDKGAAITILKHILQLQ
ncbi:MAG: DEAD/DEAH box helicase [Chloroflexi bacterium]|nr:DEAD/DEAH box helicase [Chloroflexota bacterium]